MQQVKPLLGSQIFFPEAQPAAAAGERRGGDFFE
jgi:hypothetical protein